MANEYDMQADFKEAQAMVDGLSDYLRGSELYGHAGGGFFSNLPSLTVGAILLRLRRLKFLRDQLSNAQQSKLDSLLTEWEATREEWRFHYEQKIVREAESRIDSMTTFFHECRESAANCLNNYRPELHKRTIVQELVREMKHLNVYDEAIQAKIETADKQFHSVMEKDQFQWAEALIDLYPQAEFWWLYQKPPQAKEK